MRAAVAVVIASALALGGCGDGGTPPALEPSTEASPAPSTTASPSASVSPPPRSESPAAPSPSASSAALFTAAHAEALNLQEAPRGVTLVPDISGPTTLDESTSPEQAEVIRGAGGVLAMHTKGFLSDTSPEPSPQGAWYVFSLAMVLPDEDVAAAAFQVFVDQPNPIFLDYQSDAAQGLGQQAFFFSAQQELGDPPQRHPEMGYVWRNGNALLFLQWIGVPGGDDQLDAAALRETAIAMDRAATALRGM